MNKKRTRILSMILALIVLICSIPVNTYAATPKLSRTSATIYVGQSLTLKVSDAGEKKIKWSSSNISVATVTKKGVVKSKKAGTTTIIVKVGKKKYTCKVTVKKPALSATTKKLYVGQNFTLKCKSGSLPVKWTSSKTDVATVGSAGKVTAKAAGTATITGTIYGKKYTCKVTAVEPPLNKNELSLFVGSTYHLACTDSSLKVTSWKSSKPSVATIDDSGVVTAVFPGTTKITAKILGQKYTCTVTVTKMSPLVKYGIPSYWEDELNQSLASIYDHEMNMGAHSAQFLYFTDVHWSKNAQNSPGIINYFSSLLNMDAVFGGDVIATYDTTKEAAAAEIRDFYSQFDIPVFTALGNHDSNQMSNPDSSTILNGDEMYTLLLRQEESLANTESSYQHAYFDNVSQKVRYISFFFDAHVEIDNEMYNWIDERISELPAGWTVVLFSHAAWIPKAAGKEPAISSDGKKFIDHILTLEDSVDATVACWMTGHIHRDYSQVFTSGEKSLPVIATNCDTYKISTKWGGWEMTKGTSTEQCIDAVQLDLDKKLIYMTRIGAGEDRVFSYGPVINEEPDTPSENPNTPGDNPNPPEV